MSFLSLKIFKDSKLVKTKIFTDDQISIGSSEGLNLTLTDLPLWSLLIEKKQDIFYVVNLDPETSCFVNDTQILEETLISSGSKLKIGPYVIQCFVISSDMVTESSKPVKHQASKNIESLKKQVISKPVQIKITSKKPSNLKPKYATPQKVESPIQKQASLKSKTNIKNKTKNSWSTYAAPNRIHNLDDVLTPSVGNLIEVMVCWKDRVLQSYHFNKNQQIFMGSENFCQIPVPTLIGKMSYKLLQISRGVKIFINSGVKATLFQGKDKNTRTSHSVPDNQNVNLKPYEMIRLDFADSLKVYIRLMKHVVKPSSANLFGLKASEMMAIFLSGLATCLLIFYGSFYAPHFLLKKDIFKEKDIRVAKIIFKKIPKKTQAKIVKLELKKQAKQAVTIKKRFKKKTLSITRLKKKKIRRIKKIKKFNNPKKGRTGKQALLARSKFKKKRKTIVSSARPGGSLKTKKTGSSAKSIKLDPTKIGLLGTFGSGGKLKQLSKQASGSGGLLGLAKKSTGFAGTEEFYKGESIGTKTKVLNSGGRSSALIGISGIKTKSRGAGLIGKHQGGLGKRNAIQIQFTEQDLEVVGAIDQQAIFETLKRNISSFKRCYSLSLNQDPSTQGSLSMKWQIAVNGRGNKARAVNNSIGNRLLIGCVSRVLNKLKFLIPPKGQIPLIKFTFRFSL